MSLFDSRRQMKGAPWGLGKFGFIINIIACESKEKVGGARVSFDTY